MLSAPRLAGFYQRAILDRREGHAVFVACAGGAVVGFASGGRARRPGLAEGEVETLYLLEDWRERGAGRRLMRAMGAHLRAVGCRSAMLWVLAGLAGQGSTSPSPSRCRPIIRFGARQICSSRRMSRAPAHRAKHVLPPPPPRNSRQQLRPDRL